MKAWFLRNAVLPSKAGEACMREMDYCVWRCQNSETVLGKILWRWLFEFTFRKVQIKCVLRVIPNAWREWRAK